MNMEMKQEKGIHLLSETKISHQMTLLRGLELCNCLGEELSGNVSRQSFFFQQGNCSQDHPLINVDT